MTTIPRCLCCDQPHTALVWLDGGCVGCVGAVWADALRLRDGPPEVVALRVAALRDWGAHAIVNAIIGKIPFDQGAGD